MGKGIKLLIAGVAVLAVAAGGFWYMFLRDDAPPEVSLSGAVDSIATATVQGGASATPAASSVAPTATTASVPLDGIDGTWTIAADQASFAGYRVGEELAQVGVTTAVGRTSEIEGTFVIEDSVLVSASIEADLTALASDRSMRDNALRNQALETSQFPTAEFVLTGPVTLPESLADGAAATLTIAGDLTLHGVTKAIELPVEVQLEGNYLVAVGSIELVFADYDVDQPRAASVVSIEDHGIMEIQLILGL